MITFELFPGVSEGFRKARYEVDLTGVSLEVAIRKLVDENPRLEPDLMDERKIFRPTLATFVNDRRIGVEAHERQMLGDGDVVTILMPIAGG